MAEDTKIHTQLKKSINEWFQFFEENIKRHKRSMRFAFKETVTDEDRLKLQVQGKPPVDLNYIQAYLSRILGEFSKQAPEVKVEGNGQEQDITVQIVDFVEGHLNDIFEQFRKKGYVHQLFKEQCGGGFSVFEVGTEYRNNEGFDQDLTLKKSKDPVLCFFDPMARLPSKSDGDFCGKVSPITLSKFSKQYPKFKEKASGMAYGQGVGSNINWSYKNGSVDIVLIAEIYKVEYKKYEICLLSNKEGMRVSEYNKMIEEWSNTEPPPVIAKKRQVNENQIKRYVLFGEDIIEEELTSLPGLPYVFVDGNSAFVYETDTSGKIEQITKSYIENAIDAQKVLNYIMQTIANFAENYMQQKYIVDERAIVDEKSWTNPQEASVLVKRSLDGKGQLIPDPAIPVHQADLPASIMNTYASMQQTMQNTLGTYDAMLGINERSLSGIAIQEGATQNNAVAMPFINSYLDAINAVAELLIKMIPKYYVTPMTIPIIDEDGNRTFIKINQENENGSINPEFPVINYRENDLNVSVKSGYSFTIQKEKSLKTMIALSETSERFKSLMDSDEGVYAILNNIDIRSIDKLKDALKKQTEERESKPPKPNPIEQKMMLEMKELEQKQEKMKIDAQLKIKELELEKEKVETDIKIELMKLQQSEMNAVVQNEKVIAEISTHHEDNAAKQVASAVRLADHVLKRNEHDIKHRGA